MVMDERRRVAPRDHIFMVRTNAPVDWPEFIRMLKLALEAVLHPYDGAEAVFWKVPSPKFRKKVTVLVDDKRPSSWSTLGAIVKLLDRQVWSPDTLDAIAYKLREAGFQIRGPEDPDESR